MILEIKDNNIYKSLKDIYIRENEKLLKIFYGGTGDLYFDIYGIHRITQNGINSATFCIDKNTALYPYFEELVNNIQNCNIYELNKLKLCEPDKEKERAELQEKLKNSSNYNRLVHHDSIQWYSDSIYDEKANLLKLEKNKQGILLTFIDNPEDPTFGFGIRICNSGSKYDPFNICFMNLFHQLQELVKSDRQEKPKKLIKQPNSQTN